MSESNVLVPLLTVLWAEWKQSCSWILDLRVFTLSTFGFPHLLNEDFNIYLPRLFWRFRWNDSVKVFNTMWSTSRVQWRVIHFKRSYSCLVFCNVCIIKFILGRDFKHVWPSTLHPYKQRAQIHMFLPFLSSSPWASCVCFAFSETKQHVRRGTVDVVLETECLSVL